MILPGKIDRVKPDFSQVYKYLDEHKWELEDTTPYYS